MKKPYVICHMTTSLDGKVTGEFLGQDACQSAIQTYYELNRGYQADAFACGRVTMEESFTGGGDPDLGGYSSESLPREDYTADPAAIYFAVSFDRRGRLDWKDSRIRDEDPGYDNAHIIEVLCEDVQDACLAYLREKRISYIFGGVDDLDLSLVLHKLYEQFGIRTLLLEGGSEINGAFQREGLIDELSLVVAPVVGGKEGKPLFMESAIAQYRLEQVRQYESGVLWLNYKK